MSRSPAMPASLLLAMPACLLVQSALAQTPPTSGPTVDLRYRYEQVDDDAFADTAHAHTLRLRLGYRWVFQPGWQLFVEGEHTEPLFGEKFNSTANGRVRYPVVADPQATDLNQAFVAYQGSAFGSTLGRQRINLDNQRFIGNVGWRQNEQTYDALALSYTLADGGPTLRYYYLDKVHRFFGNQHPNPLLREFDLDTHLVNVTQALPLGRLVGYAYLLENRDLPAGSTSTYGLRWSGNHARGELDFGWTIEVAQQSDYGNNPRDLSERYYLIEPSLTWHGITYKAGIEVLGGDGSYGFSTPLATLHAFNGWADRFTSTPNAGLEDRYLGAWGKFGQAGWAVIWHDYQADHGSADYGREFNALLSYPIAPRISGMLKLADYRSDGFAVDQTKLWAMVEFKY